MCGGGADICAKHHLNKNDVTENTTSIEIVNFINTLEKQQESHKQILSGNEDIVS